METGHVGFTVGELARSVPNHAIRGDASTRVLHVTHRSSEVRQGSLFFCVPGQKYDGHGFADAARAQGATAMAVEHWIDGMPLPQVRVASVRAAMGPMSAAFYGHPADHAKVVGITGTYGKTTITHMLAAVCETAGRSCGRIGSLGASMGGTTLTTNASTATTPEAPDLQRMLRRMVDNGATTIALEVTAQALEHHRTDGFRCHIGLFTNLLRNDNHWHLDHFADTAQYFRAKARLFERSLCEQAVINIDSPWGKHLADSCEIPVTTYGTSAAADLRLSRIHATPGGLRCQLNGMTLTSPLLGGFTGHNCAGTFAVCRLLGIDDAVLVQALARMRGVPGRLETLCTAPPFTVVLDYSGYPLPFANALAAVRRLAAKRLIVVFGCIGNHWHEEKRPEMGATAARFANVLIVTSDVPYDENPESIIDAIVSGVPPNVRLHRIPERVEAIHAALAMAGDGDVILIGGNARATTHQLCPEQRTWWQAGTADDASTVDDRAVVRSALSALRVRSEAVL